MPAAPILPARRLDAVLRFPGRHGHLLSRAAILVNCARAASRSSAISAASTSGGGSESVSPRLLSLIRNKSRLSLSPQGTGHFRIFPTGGFASQVWSPADGRRRFRTHDHRSRGAGGCRRRQARGVPLPSALPVGRRADTRDSNSSPVAHSMIQSLTRSRSSHAVKPSSRSDRHSAVGRRTSTPPDGRGAARPLRRVLARYPERRLERRPVRAPPHAPPLPTASSSLPATSPYRLLPLAAAQTPRTKATPSRPASDATTAPGPKRAVPAETPCFPGRGNAPSPPAAASAGNPGILRAAAAAPSPPPGCSVASRPSANRLPGAHPRSRPVARTGAGT